MDSHDREALLRAGLDPDAAPDELTSQLRVRDLLVCYGMWRRQWLGRPPLFALQLTDTPARTVRDQRCGVSPAR